MKYTIAFTPQNCWKSRRAADEQRDDAGRPERRGQQPPPPPAGRPSPTRARCSRRPRALRHVVRARSRRRLSVAVGVLAREEPARTGNGGRPTPAGRRQEREGEHERQDADEAPRPTRPTAGCPSRRTAAVAATPALRRRTLRNVRGTGGGPGRRRCRRRSYRRRG